MRLDHLLSKEEEVRELEYAVELSGKVHLEGAALSFAAEPRIQVRSPSSGSELPGQAILPVHLQLDNGISGADTFRGNTRTHPEPYSYK